MPDSKGNLYIHEAVALRKEYDNHIALLKRLLEEPESKRGGLLSRDGDEIRRPADDFHQAELEESLKKLQTKRLKLNNEIQAANFSTKIDFEGETISVAEALETRKSVIADMHTASARTVDSANNTVIHKEERDIVEKPRYAFRKSYAEYRDASRKLRKLEGLIHAANHATAVNFKDDM